MGNKIKIRGPVKVSFTKMVASGNDFAVVEESSLKALPIGFVGLAKRICDRKFGAGADGMLLLRRLSLTQAGMRIFNADGSEADMCGNGARCAAFYYGDKISGLRTPAGLIACAISKGSVKIRLTEPVGLLTGLKIGFSGGRGINAHFINTGVPHAVIFVSGLEDIDIVSLGRRIRYHKKFSPAGSNVDFVELDKAGRIKVRTYERGVEDETLACGTGSAASALITSWQLGLPAGRQTVEVKTRGGEILKVHFLKGEGAVFSDVWLEGGAKIVYKGVYNV